jgi:hypothetical protein
MQFKITSKIVETMGKWADTEQIFLYNVGPKKKIRSGIRFRMKVYFLVLKELFCYSMGDFFPTTFY